VNTQSGCVIAQSVKGKTIAIAKGSMKDCRENFSSGL
jgi:hypothetical protein